MSAGSLQGVRVLDLTDESGRLAGKLLAEAGADVVRLRRGAPGVPLQGSAAAKGGVLNWWFDGGTHYVPVDLEREADRDVARRLAARADVFIETEAPGALAARGLDHAHLAAANPRLVQVSLTPFGSQGPRAAWQASDLVASALGGALSISGTPEMPINGWGRQSFNVGGYYAAITALAGLCAARTSGVGTHVDLSLQQCVVSCTEQLLMCWFHAERFPWRIAPRQKALHWSGFYDVLPCADGHAMMTPAPTPAGLIAWLLEAGILTEVPQGAAPKSVEEQREQGPGAMALLGLLAKTRSREEIFTGAQKRNLAIGPVYSIAEAAASPQLAARSFFRPVEGEEAVRMPGPLWRSATVEAPAAAAPLATESADGVIAAWSSPAPTATGKPRRRPLEGVRVLDFTWVLAGPFATRVFGDLGADVIKLQTDERSQLTGHNDYPFFQMWNRSKRSVGLNMKHARAGEIFRRLVEQSDIVIDNFTPHVLDRWGIGYEQARQWNERIIYVSLSGCGSEGPWKDYVTFAPTIHALCGLTHLTNPADRRDVGFGFSLSDHVSGLAGALAALAALEARRKSGQGQRIDISQFEVGAHLVGPAFLEHLVNGREPQPAGNRDGFEDLVPNEVYRAADGESVAITARDDDEWRRLCEVVADASLSKDEELSHLAGRQRRRAEVDARLAAWAATVPASQAMDRLQARGVPAGMVQNAQHLVEADPQLAARDWLATVEHDAFGRQQVDRFPGTFGGDGLDPYRASPTLCQHSFEVYEELLGLSVEEVAAGIGEELFI